MEKQFIAVIIIFILIAVTVVIFLVKALLKNMEKYRAALETVNNLEQLNARMRSQRHDYRLYMDFSNLKSMMRHSII